MQYMIRSRLTKIHTQILLPEQTAMGQIKHIYYIKPYECFMIS